MKSCFLVLLIVALSTGCATSSDGKRGRSKKSEKVEKDSKARSDNHFNRVKDYFKQ